MRKLKDGRSRHYYTDKSFIIIVKTMEKEERQIVTRVNC